MSAPTTMFRAVLVSYAFPPVGGAGVQRVLKLTKFLPRHGVTPTVLTVSNPSVPVLDPSLADDVPRDVRVVRARTLEPGYAMKRAAWTAAASGTPTLAARAKQVLTSAAKQALVPDPQVLWQPAAAPALARLLAEERPDVVMISGPPFSQFLLAPLARLSPGTAVVLDYRDEWSTYRGAYEMVPAAAAAIGGALEPMLLRTADAVVTATEGFRQNLVREFSFLDPARVVAIPNGYDPDDLPQNRPEPPSDRFVMTYAGTVFRLTSAATLLGAIRRVHARDEALAAPLEARFFGRIVETEAPDFEGTEALGVRRFGYVDHDRVLTELSASHLVVCLLADAPGAERIYPGKIFELMYLGRPCLTIAPTGSLLATLCAHHHLGPVFAPGDEEGVASFLAEKLRAFQSGTLHTKSGATDVARYHRDALAGEFARVFRAAAARRARTTK